MATAFYSHVDSNAPIDAVALSFSAPYPRLEGVYARNTLLESAEKLGAGQLLKPEDLALDPSRTFLYVTTSDGWIKKLFLHDGSVQDWHHVGGRPLGLALGNHGEVIVCAADQGLLKVLLPSEFSFQPMSCISNNPLICYKFLDFPTHVLHFKHLLICYKSVGFPTHVLYFKYLLICYNFLDFPVLAFFKPKPSILQVESPAKLPPPSHLFLSKGVILCESFSNE